MSKMKENSECDSSQTEKCDSYVKNEKERAVTHEDALKIVGKSLSNLFKDDPLLCDLSSEVTFGEIQLQVALEYGQAMTINVRRGDGQSFPVVVEQTAKVIDLKKSIQNAIYLKQKRNDGTPYLSWKYVWKRYWLAFSNQKLTDDQKLIKEYGLKNRDEITFVKRLRSR